MGSAGNLTGWLLDRGAGLVVATGRRPGDGAAPSTGPAAKVKYIQADVTDRAAMERLITGLESAHTPVRGVFHAAGVLDDGILLTQNADRFQRVLEPKTTGAWHLHELTRGPGSGPLRSLFVGGFPGRYGGTGVLRRRERLPRRTGGPQAQ